MYLRSTYRIQKEEVAEEPQSLFVIRTEYKRSVQLVSKIRPLLSIYNFIWMYVNQIFTLHHQQRHIELTFLHQSLTMNDVR